MDLESLFKEIIWKSPAQYRIGLNGSMQLIYRQRDWNAFSHILLKNALKHFDFSIKKVEVNNDENVLVNTDMPQEDFDDLNNN